MKKSRTRSIGLMIAAGLSVGALVGLFLLRMRGPSPASPMNQNSVAMTRSSAHVAAPEEQTISSAAVPSTERSAGVLSPATDATTLTTPLPPPTMHAAGSEPQNAAPSPAPQSASTSQPAPAGDEVQRTQQMYLAHAPLRTAEVADPDSATNRRILQTMVEKALARSREQVPAASATP